MQWGVGVGGGGLTCVKLEHCLAIRIIYFSSFDGPKRERIGKGHAVVDPVVCAVCMMDGAHFSSGFLFVRSSSISIHGHRMEMGSVSSGRREREG